MRVDSLILENFKKFKKLEIDFSPQITLIKGKNEQGKSSLAQGFLAALFLDPRKKEDKTNLSFKAWNSSKLYSTSLRFTIDEKPLELFKDFEEGKVILRDLTTQEEINDYAKIKKILKDQGGYSSPKLYTATACILQGDLLNFQKGEKEINAALENLILSESGSNLREILKRIDKKILSLERGLKGVAKNPGTLKLLNEKIKTLESNFGLVQKNFQKLQSLEMDLKTKREAKTQVETQISAFKKALLKDQKFFEIKKKLDELDEKYSEISQKIEQLEELQKEKEIILKKIQKFPFQKEENLTNLLLTVSHLEESIHHLKKEEESKQTKTSSSFLLYLYFTLALIFFSLGILGTFVFIKSLLFLVAMGLSIPFFILYIKTRQHISYEDSSKNSLFQIQEKELKKIFTCYGVGNLKEMKSLVESFQSFLKTYDTLKEKISTLTFRSSFEDLKIQEKEVLKRIGIEESKLSLTELNNHPASETLILKEEEIRKLENQKEQLSLEINALEIQSEALKNSHEQSRILEEELVFNREKLRQEEDQSFILKNLKSHLLKAKTEVSQSFQEIFAKTCQTYLEEITSKRYSRVKMENDLGALIYSEEAGGFIDPKRNLSQGTLDQIYFIARLAFIKYIFKNQKPVIILDDPLVNFDLERLQKSFPILQKISQDYQILIFTHSDVFDSITDHVITL
jgi:DNA repair exonuclease SbcCD ATPase subunit